MQRKWLRWNGCRLFFQPVDKNELPGDSRHHRSLSLQAAISCVGDGGWIETGRDMRRQQLPLVTGFIAMGEKHDASASRHARGSGFGPLLLGGIRGPAVRVIHRYQPKIDQVGESRGKVVQLPAVPGDDHRLARCRCLKCPQSPAFGAAEGDETVAPRVERRPWWRHWNWRSSSSTGARPFYPTASRFKAPRVLPRQLGGCRLP